MIFAMHEDAAQDKRTYTLTIQGGEWTRARLHAFDRLLIAECEASDKVSDKVLALETIARRIEESAPVSTTVQREEK